MTGRHALLAALLCSAMALGLAACGKKSSPEAPGPSNLVTYPKSYPTQ